VSNANRADEVRVVVDETSFDFRELDVGSIEDYLDDFSDAVWDLREDSIATWKPPMLEAVPCAEGYELFSYLMGEPGNLIDRDTRLRFFGLIGNCPEWDDSVPEYLEVKFAEGAPVMALSAAFALTLALRRHGIACLAFGTCTRHDFVTISSGAACAKIFFFATAAALKVFWRSLYDLEDIPEADFFTLANRAFPDLLFNPDLTFRRFDGAYRDLRRLVVSHLSVLNDDFLGAHRSANGIAREVEATLASIGCPGISPEGPNTHKKERVMRMRDVEYRGSTIRCEWHAKIEPHRNRIHFAFGDDFGSSIFIGIFVDHLDT
jgi:hypothetical protein